MEDYAYEILPNKLVHGRANANGFETQRFTMKHILFRSTFTSIEYCIKSVHLQSERVIRDFREIRRCRKWKNVSWRNFPQLFT